MNLITTALRKITGLIKRGRAAGKRIFMVRGGQGAGKTISFLILIINSCSSNEDREWIILSEELTKMRDSVIKDFLKVIKALGVYHTSRWNKSDLSYTLTANIRSPHVVEPRHPQRTEHPGCNHPELILHERRIGYMLRT